MHSPGKSLQYIYAKPIGHAPDGVSKGNFDPFHTFGKDVFVINDFGSVISTAGLEVNKSLITLLFFCCTAARGANKKPYFNTLDVKGGLPEANVVTTWQHKNGYLWMGTQNGLVRYSNRG